MDKNYWMEYYKKNLAPHEPSKFALDIIERLQTGKTILELGCGNGRDSVFFAQNELIVTAIDQAQNAIEDLNKKHNNIEFLVDDFVKSRIYKKRNFDYIYSRFTMHSITKKEESKLLRNVCNGLTDAGEFIIEVRSTKDDIYGLGEKIGENEYLFEGHYRRFVEKEALEEELKQNGFKIIMSAEDRGFAPFKDQDPVLLRVIAKKGREEDINL